MTELEVCYSDCDNDYRPGPGRDICYDQCDEELKDG